MRQQLAVAVLVACCSCKQPEKARPEPKLRPRPALDAGGDPVMPNLNRPAPRAAEVKKLEGGVLSLNGHTEPILAVALDATGKRAATAGMDRSVRLWDLEEGKQLWAAGPGDEAVTTLEFDPTGEVLAAGDRAYQVRLFAVKDGALLRRRPHPDAVTSISFSPDGKWLAVAGAGGNGEVYPTGDDGPSKCELTGRTVAFTDDGKYVVSAVSAGAVIVTELPACKKKKETSTAPHLPFGAGSAKASLFATRNGGEPAVLLWDALGGRMLGKLDQQGAGVTSVAFTPDGKLAIVASEDQQARVYDVEKREVVKTLQAGPVPFATLSADGKKALVAAGLEARVHPLP